MSNEAHVLDQFQHPHILRLFHDGTDSAPWFIAVEWIAGGSLRAHLEQHGPMPRTDCQAMSVGLMDALAELHRAGVIHRDIKPDNILMRDVRDIVLCDFGIAQVPNERLTVADTKMGSLHFMAPEQRVDARAAGPAADLYAVGCTLYYTLTGWNPYNLFMAHRGSPRWETLPAPLADVLFKATRLDLAERYADSTQMASDLQAAFRAVCDDGGAGVSGVQSLGATTTLPG